MGTKLFIPYQSYIREDGVKITKYKINPKLKNIAVKIKSIDITTGKVSYKKVVEFSKHENLKMYKISCLYPIFEPFWASSDHSLIVFDMFDEKIKKVSPKCIIKDLNRYFMIINPSLEQIKNNKTIFNLLDAIQKVIYMLLKSNEGKTVINNLLNQNCFLIPCKFISIKLDTDKKVAYDFTVEDNYTFSTFDGVFVQDTMGMYFVDAIESIQDVYDKKLHLMYQIKNLQNGSFLHKLRHEMLYAMYIITLHLKPNNRRKKIIVEKLSDLKIDYKYFEKLDTPVYIKNLDTNVSYGIAVINKILFGDQILINEKINKKNVEIINEKLFNFIEEKYKNLDEYKKNKIYFDKLHELIIFLTSFLTSTNYNPYIHENDYLTFDDIISDIDTLPDEPIIGDIKFRQVVDKAIQKMKENDSILYKIYESGARASKDQLKQVIVARGYIADDRNIVLKKPIKSNLMQGLSEEELFVSSFGARKGLVDKIDFTPVSGYIERTMVMNTSYIDVNRKVKDCKTKRTLNIKVFSESHAKSLIGRYFVDKNGKLVKITKNNYKNLVGKEIKLRSPIYCTCENHKVCLTCCGDFESNMNLGMASSQFIAERFTQLTLRTFHISAAANLDIPKELFEIINIEKIDGNYYRGSKDEIRKINKILEEKVNSDRYKVWITDDGEIKSEGVLINKDIITTIKNVKRFLTKTFPKVKTDMGTLTPELVYTYIMQEYLKHGFIKSLYLEVVLSPLWVDKEILKPIKYLEEIDWDKIMKISLKKAGELASKLLHLLYEPNRKSALKYIIESSDDIETPYHKIVKF